VKKGALKLIVALAGLASVAYYVIRPSAGQLSNAGAFHSVQLEWGKTIVLRAAAGDTVTVLSPIDGGIPQIGTVSPSGLLTQVSGDAATSSATFKINDTGSGNIQSSNSAGEAAILTVDAA
jgi:hypothetical protein